MSRGTGRGRTARLTAVVGTVCALFALVVATALGTTSQEKQILSNPPLATEAALSLPGSRLLLLVGFPKEEGTGLAELRTDGSLDPNFGQGGIIRVPENFLFAGTREWADQAAVDQQGRLLLVGTSEQGQRPTVMRLLPNGAIDTSFGTNGTAQVDLGLSFGNGHSVAVEPDGDILVGGFAATPCTTGSSCEEFPAVARLNEDGNPDPSFGQDGRKILHTPLRTEGPSVLDLACAPHGKILLATGSSLPLEIRRLQPNGAVDRSFGKAGEIVVHEAVPTPPGSRTEIEAAPKIAVLPDGKIVVVGEVDRSIGNEHPSYSAMIVLRYRANGRPDRSFGHFGHVTLGFGTESSGSSFVVRKNGGVVVAGQGRRKKHAYFALASLLPDGRLDSRFGQGGMAKVRFGGWVQETGLVLQRQKAVAVGYQEIPGPNRTVLARVPLAR